MGTWRFPKYQRPKALLAKEEKSVNLWQGLNQI